MRKGDWVEQALIDWAAWVHQSLDAQGFGGIDAGGREKGLRGRGAGHGDPVLAEIIATDIDGQGQNQRVHRHLRRYAKDFNKEWFWVVWVRYVGVPKAMSTKTIVAQEQVAVVPIASKHDFSVQLQVEIPRTFVWSGMRELSTVADVTGIKQRNVEIMIANTKRELAMDLRMDIYVLTGKVMPDGWGSAKEKENAEAAKSRRLAEREKRNLQFCG
jgi:hypothetical protein